MDLDVVLASCNPRDGISSFKTCVKERLKIELTMLRDLGEGGEPQCVSDKLNNNNNKQTKPAEYKAQIPGICMGFRADVFVRYVMCRKPHLLVCALPHLPGLSTD